MTHPATPMPPAPGPVDRPAARLDAVLDAALASARRASGTDAVVGTLAGIRPDNVRHDLSLDHEVLAGLFEQVAAAPDGCVASAEKGRAGRWTGFRYGLGGARSAFIMVAAAGLDDLAAARLEALALDVSRAALLDDERNRSGQLKQLLATARQVAESLELDTVLASIVRDATTLLGADSGDMLLWDRDQDVLRVVAVSNFPPDMLGFELAFGEGISSQAILAQRTIEVDQYRTYEHRAKALDRYDFGSVLCAPLIFRGVAIGAINVHAHAGQHRFPSGGADLLAAFAGHAAIAIDHARRYENEVTLGRDLADTNRGLTRLLTMQQRLAEHVLLDGSPDGIATLLAEDLGRPVVIQDHLRRCVAGAAPDGSDVWRRLIDASDGSGRGGQAREPFAVAVHVGRDLAGHLLLSSDDDLGPIDRALVDAATTGVALAFAKVRAALEVEERLRGEAVADLLGGDYPTEEAIGARAARLGYDLDEPRDLLVIRLADGDPGDAPGPLVGHDRQRRALDAVRERLAVRTPRSLAVIHAGSIVVMAGTVRTPALDPGVLADDLRSCLDAIAGIGPVTIAISDRCRRPDDYAPAFRLARESVDLMLKLGRRGAVVTAGELGPYRLLLRASSRDDLEEFATRTLRPLLDPARPHAAELLRTLRTYLDEDRVQRRAAARCFVHVNTIVYRIHRIEELLGVDLDDPATVFDLTLALRIQDLRGGEPRAPRETRAPREPRTPRETRAPREPRTPGAPGTQEAPGTAGAGTG